MANKSTSNFVYSSEAGYVKRYIDFIAPMAKQLGAKYDIPWKALVAQSCLETGYGKSTLVQNYNNFAGIKASGGVDMTTKEYVDGHWVTIKDGFGYWSTPYAGFEGYCLFFHANSRYKNAIGIKDPMQFVEAVYLAGYATDPNYVTKVQSVYNKYVKDLSN